MHFLDILTSKSGPRMVCFAYILISKCISRYNNVHFFGIVISKNGPTLRYFIYFYLEMYFAL